VVPSSYPLPPPPLPVSQRTSLLKETTHIQGSKAHFRGGGRTCGGRGERHRHISKALALLVTPLNLGGGGEKGGGHNFGQDFLINTSQQGFS
jgi:hypothetical protein